MSKFKKEENSEFDEEQSTIPLSTTLELHEQKTTTQPLSSVPQNPSTKTIDEIEFNSAHLLNLFRLSLPNPYQKFSQLRTTLY